MFTTANSVNATAQAQNLAAAINRNLSSAALDRFVGVASANTVTIYLLTPGSNVFLLEPGPLGGVMSLSWAAASGAANGTQANIVGLNQLYSGTSPFCTGKTFPQFIFSYASGVGPVATSPSLSLDGKKIAYVENDANIGAILHVLTLGTGTEVGTCGGTNTGTSTPTCAIGAFGPVIPGSTASSNATDFMLPLGLLAANASTGGAGAIDSFSSLFPTYSNDTGYVGDNNGIMYAITPLFLGTPAFRGGVGWPVAVNIGTDLSAPVVDVGNAGNIFVGDSSGNLYNYTLGGISAGNFGLGNATGGGVRDAAMIDSTNGVGYVTVSCSGTGGSSVLNQFGFSSNGLTTLRTVDLNARGCDGPVMYSPSVDNNYFNKGISSATAANNGELQVCFAGPSSLNLAQFQFVSGTMGASVQFLDSTFSSALGNLTCSPLTEFYGSNGSYALTGLSQSGTTATVTTAVQGFTTGQSVTIAGVAAGGADCPTATAQAFNGTHPVTVSSGTTFTYTDGLSGTITTCNISNATATGPTDYTFFGASLPGVWTFTTGMVSSTQAFSAQNTTNLSGGTSGIIVDNDSSDGQAASIYFGNLTSISNQCSTGIPTFCAVKLTQSALQ